MADSEIEAVEKEIGELIVKLNALRKENPGEEVPNYVLATVDGERSLLDLFGSRDKLLMIHNMGQGCRYCTLWADGFNGLVAHLESAMSVVLVSKDAPDVQRRFASSRGWRGGSAAEVRRHFRKRSNQSSCRVKMSMRCARSLTPWPERG